MLQTPSKTVASRLFFPIYKCCVADRTIQNLNRCAAHYLNICSNYKYCVRNQSQHLHSLCTRNACQAHPVLSRLSYGGSLLITANQTLLHLSIPTRHNQTDSKFRIWNSVYFRYLKSLTEEMEELTQSQLSLNNLSEQQQLRLNFLKPVMQVIRLLLEQQAEVQELQGVASGEKEPEMVKLIQLEIEACDRSMEKLEKELIDLLVGEEPADNSDIVLEVSAGVGGQEAMLFASEIFDMYCKYAHYKGWTILSAVNDQSEIGGTRKSAVEIRGREVYRHLKHEAGVHRVQRVPKTEKAGRVHTSTITVSILPQPGEIDVDIQPSDLKVETFRNTGPGGQSVNTTDSAVRIVHIPTGTVSECRQERSQLKNKEKALKNLKNKIYQNMLEEQLRQMRTTRKMHMGTRARSDKIRTYNFQQDRITDHRLKESASDLMEFMNGNEKLDEIIYSLAQLEKIQYLESMLDEFEAESQSKTENQS